MANIHSLIDLIKVLLSGDSESVQIQDWYEKDPQAVLQYYGLDEYTPEDVHDAIVLMQDNDTVSFDRNYDTGFDGGKGGWNWDGGKEGGHDGGHHHAAASHEKVHVTDNYYEYDVDDRDTIVDNSINQNVDTGGGDFRQDIETNSVTASGDGAVAAGRDIDDSTITTGNGNIVGDDNNVVDGDGNTTAFGSGDATSVGDIKADNGSAVSIGGNATGSNDTVDSYNEDNDTTTNETEIEDSYNQDNSTDNSQDNDSYREDNSVTENHFGSHNSLDIGVEA
ncbi:hypothetical protein SAMN05216207_1010128 [Pseudonocardia ammonioxydans]|uniref:Dentin sialophosphoprotein n=1 Tax=Pseudonocardia ammonioxydans TaxID=260086 RepID=A0A1I4X7Z6_PSUAM|nr:hypothetical protein [Pseudonocardia ammonioxydans]SFN22014.1 hypothetical protein SAMN05216207_1010128 [Pseudonocardia ammonioxydans]